MGGGLMQLVAYGAQDIYLTGNPQITFFKVVYRRHTNFSMEHIQQTFKGTPGANARVVATISRNGDLVHDCYLKVFSIGNDILINPGHAIIDNIECEIGGQLIDRHYGHWMEAHAELTEETRGMGIDLDDFDFGVTPSNTKGLDGFRSVAYAGGVNGVGSNVLPDFYVPLRFWFCRHIGLALPLIALQYHEVNIIINKPILLLVGTIGFYDLNEHNFSYFNSVSCYYL